MKRYSPRLKKRAPVAPKKAAEWLTVDFPARIDPRDGSFICEAKSDHFNVSTMLGAKAYASALEDLRRENENWAECEAVLKAEMC